MRKNKACLVLVAAHMPNLQKEFFRQNAPKFNETAPFLDVDKNEVEAIMDQVKNL